MRPRLISMLPWLLVLLLLAFVASEPAVDGKRRERPSAMLAISRWVAWLMLMPVDRQAQPPLEVPPDETPVEDAFVIHNQPPERDEGPAGHAVIDHGFGW